MSVVISTPRKTSRRSSSSNRTGFSYGRGGAGNTAQPTVTDMEPVDLQTPCIKGEVYTTGRGGRGNMVKNTDPDEARRAQDVTIPPRRGSESYTHIGRGGAANVIMPNMEGISVGTQESSQCEIMIEQMPAKVNVREEDKDVMGLADKGKEWLLSRCRRATSDIG